MNRWTNVRIAQKWKINFLYFLIFAVVVYYRATRTIKKDIEKMHFFFIHRNIISFTYMSGPWWCLYFLVLLSLIDLNSHWDPVFAKNRNHLEWNNSSSLWEHCFLFSTEPIENKVSSFIDIFFLYIWSSRVSSRGGLYRGIDAPLLLIDIIGSIQYK